MSRYQDWHERLEESKEARALDRKHRAAEVRYAKVDAAKLAESPDWHRFQEIIQGAIFTAKEDLEGIGPAFLDVDLVSHDDLLALKMKGSVLMERVTSLEMVLNMPNMLKESSEVLEKELEEIEWRKRAS